MKTVKNNQNIIMLFIVQLLEQIAMVNMRTVIVPYAKTELMMSMSLLGILTGALSVASMASRFSASGLMSRLSYLKLIRVSMVAELVAYCFYSGARQFIPLVIVRLASGFFSGVTGTAIIALAGTMFSVERMGFGLGIFGYSQMAALGVSPALSMVLYNRFGSGTFFMIEIVVEALAFIMTFFIKETEEKGAVSAKRKDGNGKCKTRIILPSAVFPSCLNFFFQVAYASVSTFIIVYGQEKGWQNAGLFYTIYAIGSLIVRPAIGSLLDHKGMTLPISICAGSFAFSMIVLATAKSFPMFLFAACLMTVGFGGGWSICQASALKCEDPGDKGAASATYFLINDLGMLVGAAIAGVCAEAVGYSRTFVIFIIPIVIGWLIYHAYLGIHKVRRV